MDIPLLDAQARWECPNCPARHVTTGPQPHLPFHNCPGLHGILAPYVAAGTRCKVEAVVREDYAGSEKGLRYDAAGRPVSSVITVRDDGQDCAVYPGSATAEGE